MGVRYYHFIDQVTTCVTIDITYSVSHGFEEQEDIKKIGQIAID